MQVEPSGTISRLTPFSGDNLPIGSFFGPTEYRDLDLMDLHFFSPLDDETMGASELAGLVPSKALEFQRYFSTIGTPLVFKTGLFASFGRPRPTAKPVEIAIDRSFLHIEDRIKASLEAEPIEDGFLHPAEAILESAIHLAGQYAMRWLFNVFSSDRCRDSAKADLLRLLGRLKPLTREQRYVLVELGLSSEVIELRDAAVQAAEGWEDESIVPLLLRHRESCSWLADYISEVVHDLAGK